MKLPKIPPLVIIGVGVVVFYLLIGKKIIDDYKRGVSKKTMFDPPPQIVPKPPQIPRG